MNKEFTEDNYKLIQYVSSIVGKELSVEDREDLVNDTVLKLLETSVEARQDNASALINRVMGNLLIDNKRTDYTDAISHTVSLDTPTDEDSEEGEGYTLHDIVPDDAETEHYSQVYKGDIEELCSHLSPLQARLFKMRYYLGLKPTEIAEQLNVGIRSVETTLHRAVRNAFKLTNVQREDTRAYQGMTIQEMALVSIDDDDDLFPFLLYYREEQNLMRIATATGRCIESIKLSIKSGEDLLYAMYGFDMNRRGM